MSCDRWKLVIDVLCRLAGEHADAAGRGPRGVAERRLRDQAARVDWVQRHVGTDRGVGRRPQLRLVVDAVQPQAAREVDQRLLLRQRPQHGGRRLQRRQLAVGVQDAELRIVLAEGGADVGVVRDAVAILVVAVDQRLDHVAERAAVGGEVLLHAHGAAAEGHDRHQVRRLHLRVDERLRRGVGTHLIARRHRGQIEVQDQQPAVAVAGVARRRDRDLSLRRRRHADRRGEARRGRGGARLGRPIRQTLILDEADRLRLVVFGDDEVGWAVRPSTARPSLSLTLTVCDDEARAAAKDRLLRRQLTSDAEDTTATKAASHLSADVRRADRHQNLTRRLLCSLRIGFAAVGKPNCGLPTKVFTAA